MIKYNHYYNTIVIYQWKNMSFIEADIVLHLKGE